MVSCYEVFLRSHLRFRVGVVQIGFYRDFDLSAWLQFHYITICVGKGIFDPNFLVQFSATSTVIWAFWGSSG